MKNTKPNVYAIVNTNTSKTVEITFTRADARLALSDYKQIHKNFKIAKLSFDKFIR